MTVFLRSCPCLSPAFVPRLTREGPHRRIAGIRIPPDDFTVLARPIHPTGTLLLLRFPVGPARLWGGSFHSLGPSVQGVAGTRRAAPSGRHRTYTLLAFSIGAGLAGVAGALYARLIEFVDPRGFYIGQSFDFFLATVVGGLGTLVGPLIGVSFITVLTDRLRIAGDYYRVWFGLFVIVVVLVAPKGVAGTFAQLRTGLRARRDREGPRP